MTRCKKSLVKTVDHRNLQAVPIILVDRQVVTFASTSLQQGFMMHDAWENALFVHWPVLPERLTEMLPRRCVQN